MKRSEKFFPEETFLDKATLVSEIRVPKNLNFLTDKLPGPNYDISSGNRKINKNRSEIKMKLPKLNNSTLLIDE